MPTPATLSATFSATPEALNFEYTLINTSTSDLFVMDVSGRVSSTGVSTETGKPVVDFTPNSGTVRLLFRLEQRDPRRRYAVPPRPYVALLAKGETRKITGSLGLPLIPHNLAPSNDVEEQTVDHISLIVGIVPTSAFPNAIQQNLGGTPLWRLPNDRATEQIELRFDATVPAVKVLIPA